MNIDMKIKVEEQEEPLKMEGDCSFDDEHVQGIHDCPQKVVRKRPRDKNYKAVIMKTEEGCANSPVVKRAEEVQANLSPEFPSFFKIMIPSVVCRGFWMALPKDFCQLHLPNHDATVILVGETGNEYQINFLVRRRALSGGWKKFSEEHGLLVGDAVVFQLTSPSKFKVYIVRLNGLAEVDAALGLLRLQSSANQTGIWPILQDSNEYEVHMNGLSCLRAEENQSENGSLDVGSSEVDGIRLSLEEKADSEQPRDAIRASEISTLRADFVTSENTLSSLELLGVEGGLHNLHSLTFESKQEVESRRYKEAESLELELLRKKEEMQRLDTEIEGLTVNSKRYKLMFEAAANAPW